MTTNHKPATALPWTIQEASNFVSVYGPVNERSVGLNIGRMADLEYIVEACNAYPQLIEDKRRLMEALYKYVEIHDEDTLALLAELETR